MSDMSQYRVYCMTPCLTDERVVELECRLHESEERVRREQGRRQEAERRERDLTQEHQQTARQVQTLRQEREGLFTPRVVTSWTPHSQSTSGMRTLLLNLSLSHYIHSLLIFPMCRGYICNKWAHV